jgi:hypothetical protein
MRIDSRAHHSQKWIEKTRNLNSNPFNSLSISLCSKDNFVAKFQFSKGSSHAPKTHQVKKTMKRERERERGEKGGSSLRQPVENIEKIAAV